VSELPGYAGLPYLSLHLTRSTDGLPAIARLRAEPSSTLWERSGVALSKRSGAGEPMIGMLSMVMCVSKVPDCGERQTRRYVPSSRSRTEHATASSFGHVRCTRAPPEEHTLPILSDALSSTVHPASASSPTTPCSGSASSGSTVDSAEAGPAETASMKGLPGSWVPSWRSPTCSIYLRGDVGWDGMRGDAMRGEERRGEGIGEQRRAEQWSATS
jgi:hypothetical protein